MIIIYPPVQSEFLFSRNPLQIGSHISTTVIDDFSDDILSYTCPTGRRAILQGVDLDYRIVAVDTTSIIVSLFAKTTISAVVTPFCKLYTSDRSLNTHEHLVYSGEVTIVAGEKIGVELQIACGTGNGGVHYVASLSLLEFDAI
jgi:hypothetical protein